MIPINEFQQIVESIDDINARLPQEIIDQAESFHVEEDVVDLVTKVSLYDESGSEITTFDVEDYDVAIAFLEEAFDLDWGDEGPDAQDTRWGQGSRNKAVD